MASWNDFFEIVKSKDYYKSLNDFWDKEYALHTVFPPRELIFNAFNLTPLDQVKVVVIGQDPYHEKGQAMGLAFSVPNSCKCPPSLVNIFKEIEIETGKPCKRLGDLTYLTKQGVFLVNTILTVREGEPMSHKIKEYACFIQDLLGFLEKNDQPMVYMLWGGPAQKYEKYITNKNHLIIKRTHPSPLGANHGGWFNENQFNLCNEFLEKNNLKKIEWNN
ncbi:MAG: uracil-DNA glycosylase [Firmicutes bacterium]|nr:uracil-DNA glycosylase [Candidatus Fiminaster equi]